MAIANTLVPARNTRALLIKWIIGLLVPLVVFTFIWSGEEIINQSLLSIFGQGNTVDVAILIETALFLVIFYATLIVLAGYLVAADSGRRGMIELWVDIAVFVVLPLFLVMSQGLIIGFAVSAIIWVIYLVVRGRVYKALHIKSPTQNLKVLNAEQLAELKNHAVQGSFWFSVALAIIWLIVDLIFYLTGQLPTTLLIWAVIRTLLLPIAGYLLGQLAGTIALRRTLSAEGNGNGGNAADGSGKRMRRRQLENLSTTRAREEARDLVPNDLPQRSSGATRFYLILLVTFVLFYPVIDQFLFGFGTEGRLASYGDAGYYVILALGLNIVVGFAGLLDLGYVAFFAIGAYAWGIFGSTQLTNVLNLAPIDPHLLSALFWPMIIVAALIAALFGVLLGAPTLRLRGDYLAIVTLGFGEIVPIVFLEMDKYTNGTNGIVGVHSPSFFGINWSVITPTPYYYLILALIALSIFVNIRLRDSRLGRAWIAIREDEIAAASSGVNLVSTKLFAFATGAFFAGIAGAFHAAKLGQVSPDNFSFGDSVIFLAMVVIGGIGSIPGVIVGAILVYALNVFLPAQLDASAADPTSVFYGINNAIVHFIPGFSFGNVRNLIFGALLVVIMIFRPEGLIPSARRRREFHEVEEEGVEVGALDVVPGAPGFEEEVRVE
ncbi:MAG TPA: branched-chain amino acid ABC transporter permease [Ktedonobacteraceae bacterium]|nr:branched-chain amino acid ABC transporter permease [Ktedonobacteraceae bacterium]